MGFRQQEIAEASESARAIRFALPLITVEEPQLSEYLQKELKEWGKISQSCVNSWLKNQQHIDDLREILLPDPVTGSIFCYARYATVYLKQPPTRMSELAPILRKLATKGFRQNGEPKISSISPGREIYLKRGDYAVTFSFSMSLGEGGCELVQKGTKTTETPIYEMVCPEEMEGL